MSLLEVTDVSVAFGGLVAVDSVSFEIAAGERVGIIGPNGAGKTTLLSAICGAVSPTSGEIRLNGQSITGLRPDQVCRLGVGRTFQVPKPFGGLTVAANVDLAKRFGGGRDLDTRQILETCGLASHHARRAQDLGPGDLRRLELAKALGTAPTVVLTDEIGAGMPSDDVGEMARHLDRLASSGVTLVMVEHVMELLLRLVTRLIVLDSGRLIADDHPDAVLADPRVAEAYFGKEMA